MDRLPRLDIIRLGHPAALEQLLELPASRRQVQQFTAIGRDPFLLLLHEGFRPLRKAGDLPSDLLPAAHENHPVGVQPYQDILCHGDAFLRGRAAFDASLEKARACRVPVEECRLPAVYILAPGTINRRNHMHNHPKPVEVHPFLSQ